MLGPTAEPTLLTAWQALSDVQTSKNSLGMKNTKKPNEIKLKFKIMIVES